MRNQKFCSGRRGGGFVKNTRKRGPAGKHCGVFPHRYSQNYILNWKFNTKLDTIRDFLSKIRTLFLIFQKGRGGFPTVHSYVPLNVVEYASISWICLNILENAWINFSDYAKTLNMPDYLTFSTGIWRHLGF